ncbi:MAG TPA: sensor histidine kinase [Candidatus Intestinimonas stercoravium]|uniref:sensor histidine kinase n=1 Tax=uncultured Intestinimonas sp. TaxID=1689265 RepID=UPI001F97A4ED|nr:ATP-binding protein [uncultured Intestinimonas sp.]HJA64242.1 sensor histidine kinase [Candidatus Intestinimonas stercoravium]
MARRKGIRRRWMLNSISAVLLIVLFAVAAFSAAIGSYFYSTMSIGLDSRITSSLPFFSGISSQSEFLQSASNYVQTFADKNRLELQIINANGSIYRSTNDLTLPGSYPDTPDVASAIGDRAQTPWTGSSPDTGERIMSVSAPILSANGTLMGVIRIVTSLERADLQVMKIVAVALAVGAAIVLLVYFSNLYFVRSIVEPVMAVTDTAKRIAGGSYGIQMEKKYDDEVGDLIDAVNDMSMKIKQSEKLKSEFISSVSHELRTPLTAINGWAETIMNGEVRDASDVKKGMGIIVSEARRLTNMVEELLEFSRIEDGRFTLSVEPMDIKAELEDAVYTYTEFFRREGIVLTHTDCEEEFPPIPGDPERMRQVFCNLLDNAAKHGGSGHRIDTAIHQEGDAAVITIRDYGPGIPEDELPHVKYKFYKGSSKARGSGIGLAVCEEIVTRHNGRLDIGNAEGGGCIVTIRLPIGT